MRARPAVLVLLAVLLAAAPAARADGLAVRGNQLVDDAGRTVRLVGVNRSGTEYACAGPIDGQRGGPYGYAVFQGPTNAQSIAALQGWGVNAVALPLNEACWLGTDGHLNPRYRGTAYRRAIRTYVSALHARGIAVVLRLSGAAPGDRPYGSIPDASSDEIPMADRDHALDFWRSVARTFRGDRQVLFHAFDEPHDVSWRCVLRGCVANDRPQGKVRYGRYRAVGHQAIVDAIRGQGARQPIILSGPSFAGDLSQWLTHVPRDPRRQLLADVSSFDYADYVLRGRARIAKVAAKVPVVIGGFGDTDCNSDYSEQVMATADALGLSMFAWTWNTVQDYGGCENALLDGDDAYLTGAPSGFGAGVRAHYLALAGQAP